VNFRLAGLLNCWKNRNFSGSSATISSAFLNRALHVPFAPSASTTVAPNAFSNLRRSMLMVSDRQGEFVTTGGSNVGQRDPVLPLVEF
jgi:hypothetical protein